MTLRRLMAVLLLLTGSTIPSVATMAHEGQPLAHLQECLDGIPIGDQQCYNEPPAQGVTCDRLTVTRLGAGEFRLHVDYTTWGVEVVGVRFSMKAGSPLFYRVTPVVDATDVALSDVLPGIYTAQAVVVTTNSEVTSLGCIQRDVPGL